jgi:integrase
MSVTLRRQRNGNVRPFWYGEYVRADGTRRVINLNVKWDGKLPRSGSLRDRGNAVFEATRVAAEAALEKYQDEARRKGRAEHLTERLIEEKTGAKVEYTRLADLGASWLALPRGGATLSDGHVVKCKAVFKRFLAFMAERRAKAVYCYQVTNEDVNAFSEVLRVAFSPGTYAAHFGILRPAFDRFLPPGARNPFRAGLAGKRGAKSASGSVHRKPFTPDQLQALLDEARGDELMYPLITAAACTGMRRGDVCRLRWEDVDLAAGMLTVKTSKTGAQVEIPIFAPLRSVLDGRGEKGAGEYVFPEAVSMLKHNRHGLTWRFKKLAAKALNGNAPVTPLFAPTPETEQEGTAAVMAAIPDGERRARMLDCLHRYCAGEKVCQIRDATGHSKSTVSTDLSAIEALTGKPFVRTRGADMHEKIRLLTRVKRPVGKLSASLYDWHALRTTFVTLALSAGVPLELVRRVTGHGTVAVVLEHYFRPDREQFKAALTKALPAVLTGDKAPAPPPVAPHVQELGALVQKLAANTATKKDRKRFQRLAARI